MGCNGLFWGVVMYGIGLREWIKTVTTIVFLSCYMLSYPVHCVFFGDAMVNNTDPDLTLMQLTVQRE